MGVALGFNPQKAPNGPCLKFFLGAKTEIPPPCRTEGLCLGPRSHQWALTFPTSPAHGFNYLHLVTVLAFGCQIWEQARS